MSDVTRAPWTAAQVAWLHKRQASRNFHPYTCGNRDGHPMDPEGDYGVLVPTVNGWVCRHCDYTQNWCHTAEFGISEEMLETSIFDLLMKKDKDVHD